MKLIKSKKENKIEIRRKLAFFPKNYELINIEDIFSIKRGRVISNDYILKNKGIYPVYSSATENRGEIGKISTFDIEGEKITWTTDGYYAGTIFYRSGKYNCTNICGILDLKSDGNVKYYSYLLKNIFPKYVTKTDNRKLMSNTVSKIEFIHTNDIKEQNLITKVIESQETQLENIKQLIKKIETRNQYYAEKILSGELLVKKNENGLLDIYENTKWKNATINNLIKKVPFEFKISKIKGKFKEFPKSKIKAGDAKNIKNGNYPFFNCSDKQSLFFNDYIINDEVLYLSTGGKPAIHYFNGKASYSTDVWAIAFDKDIINKYAYYYIKHNIKTLNHCFNGAALKHLNKNDFRNIDIIYPNHNEQILIINLLDNLEYETSYLQKILKKEQLRFQWLLDNLLSGEYQVVDE